MALKSDKNDRLLVDREELARLCAKSEGTVRLWLRQGIIERANPAAPPGEKALFDLAVCLPRILSFVSEKRELTEEEKALAAARLRILNAKAAAELDYQVNAGELHTTESVLLEIGSLRLFSNSREGSPVRDTSPEAGFRSSLAESPKNCESLALMVSPDLASRRNIIALLAVSVKDRTFRPELITGLSELFQVTPTTIYSDLRHLEPELGRLLLNKTNEPPRCARKGSSTNYAGPV